MNDEMRASLWSKGSSWAALLAAVAVCLFGVWYVQPPAPKPEDAPAAEFSAQRAFQHLLVMCQETHPHGSQAAMRVREYLEQTIRDMGYEPEVQKTYVFRRDHKPPYHICYVENVIVHVPGTDPDGAFLNMAHYDSVPYGLGASDDGAGCASMLEILRALKHHPPVKNDLIFLFTDGEEAGLLGPRAFMQHPLYPKVKTVLNYEARGYYGPSMMFELSDENGWLIDQVAAVATHPVASSVMFDVAGRMPTTTDFEILKEAGLPGMGLAYVGGIEYYHTPNDSPDTISRASIQHHGEYGLPLALHMGNAELNAIRAPNKIYFDFPGLGLVRYPMTWLPMLTAVGVLLCLVSLTIGLLRDRFTTGAMLAGALVHIVAVLVVAVLVGAVLAAGLALNQEYVVYRTFTYLAGFLALTLGVYGFLLRAAACRLSASAIAAGGLLLWAPILVVVAVTFPGGSYIAMWPIVAGSIGLGLVWLLGDRLPHAANAGITWLGALPALFILAPLLYISVLSVTIVPSSFWMANFILMLTLVSPLLVTVLLGRGVWIPAAAAGVAVPLLLLAVFGVRFTPETPKMNHLCYGLNCTTGEAFWLSNDQELDDWLRNFFDENSPREPVADFVYGADRDYLRAPAPKADLPEAQVEVLEDHTEGDVRELLLKIASPRKAARMDIAIAPEVDVLSAAINGRELGRDKGKRQQNDGEHWRLRYQGNPLDGIELQLQVAGDAPFKIIVREESFGIPPIPGINVPMRPENMITENNVKGFWKRGYDSFRSNILFTMKEFDIPAGLPPLAALQNP